MPLQSEADVEQLDSESQGAPNHDIDDCHGVDDEPDPPEGRPAGGAVAETDSKLGGPHRSVTWRRLVRHLLLPSLLLILAICAGYLKFVSGSSQNIDSARAESVHVAADSTIAMLSYHAETVEKDLAAAQNRMTGSFRDSYAKLTRDVVIPGAKEKQISATATVPAAASVSVNQRHAVVLVFVDQAITIAKDAPSKTASSVRVSLDYVSGHWLISSFDPI